MTINLYTEKGFFKKIKWGGMILTEIDNVNNFEVDSKPKVNQNYQIYKDKKEVLDFDLTRYCEIEILKSNWITLKGNLTDHDLILNKISALFEPSFQINNVWFDDIGYLVFKIHMTAVKKGQLHSFLEIGILIEIKGNNETISNEVKKNCLVFDRKNELQIRIGDVLIFYLSKNK